MQIRKKTVFHAVRNVLDELHIGGRAFTIISRQNVKPVEIRHNSNASSPRLQVAHHVLPYFGLILGSRGVIEKPHRKDNVKLPNFQRLAAVCNTELEVAVSFMLALRYFYHRRDV